MEVEASGFINTHRGRSVRTVRWIVKNRVRDVYSTVGNVLATEMSQKVFREIMSKRFMAKFAYCVHKIFRHTFLGILLIFSYGITLSRTYRIPKKDKHEIISTSVYKNETRQISFIEECIGEGRITRMKHSKRYVFSPGTPQKILGNLLKIRKTYKLIKLLNRKYSFMPACRCSYAVFLYFSFVRELQTLKPKAILFANDYSPDGVALSRAAMKLDIPTIYIKHAFLDAISNRAPINFDLTFLDGPKELENCVIEENSKGKIVFKGMEGHHLPLRLNKLKQTGMKIGVFLTGLLNLNRFADLIMSIQQNLLPSLLLIRPHPNPLNEVKLNPYTSRYNNIKITSRTTLEQDATECNLAIVGNSTAVLEILKLGTPAVYYQLETSPDDICGFIKSGIVPKIEDFSKFSTERIKEFYSSNWIEKFLGYDPYYGKNIDVNNLVKEEVEILLQKSRLSLPSC